MILVIAEHQHNALKKSARELITAAKQLATELNTSVAGAVLAEDATTVAAELATYVDTVYAVSDAALKEFRAEPYTTAVTQLAQETGANVVLVSASRAGLSFSPRLALRMDTPLLEDVVELAVVDGLVQAKRFSYLARVTETVQANSLPVVISVKPNIFPVAEANASGTVETKNVSFTDADTRVTVGDKVSAQGGRVALEEASVVVTGGRGVGGEEGFTNLIEPLADTLSAGIGATRAVVDAGWRPYAEQVGQTGKTVSPDVYFALGVSGAVQHLSGMNRSKVIVAVNKDADAPIFKVADYGIVGDVNTVVPALKAALESE